MENLWFLKNFVAVCFCSCDLAGGERLGLDLGMFGVFLDGYSPVSQTVRQWVSRRERENDLKMNVHLYDKDRFIG